MGLSREDVDNIVAEHIAPILAVDGGTAEVLSVDSDALSITVRLGGTYRGNPCRGIVTAYVIRPILQKYCCEEIRVELAD